MKNIDSHNNNDVFLAQWLSGDLTDAELKLLVSEDDFKAYLKLRSGLNISEQLNRPIEPSFSVIEKRIQQQPKVRTLNNWLIGVAASVVILVGMFMFLNNSDISVTTGFGESKTIALLDGSQVILNSKSTITYNEDNWENHRELTLTGEAYFNVEKGNTFTVNTDNGSVTVLGTQFNVNSTEDFFDVVCYEGKVKVITSDAEHILLPTQTVRKINGLDTETNLENSEKPTWIDGESTFKSVPLKYVITALEDNYNIKFSSEDIDESVIFSGTFPHNNLNIALKTVFGPLNITYSEKEKRNIKLRY